MSRQIKFRVWDKLRNEFWSYENSEFLNVSLTFDGRPLFWTGDSTRLEGKLWPEEWIIQQFTGFIDKNGKEVYEGDIVDYFEWCYCSARDPKYTKSQAKIVNIFKPAYGGEFSETYYPLRGEVKWNQEFASYEPLVFSQDDYDGNCFASVCSKSDIFLNSEGNPAYPDAYFEVVGNIFQNPELLK